MDLTKILDQFRSFVEEKTDYLRSRFTNLTKILNRSIQIYLVTFVQKKTDYLRSLFIDLTNILNRSIQIYLLTFENRLSKITLYRSDQVSEEINSDLSGNICSKENISKITLYRSDQDSEQINSDLSFVRTEIDYLRSVFIDLTKILNRSIQIYLVTFVQKKTK